MTEAIQRSFAAQIAELEEAIRQEWRWIAPDAGFAVWLSKREGMSLPVDRLPVSGDKWGEAPFVAATGYLLAAGALERSDVARWSSSIELLMKKEPLPSDRNSFMFRPVELFGIAVGVTALDDAVAARSWLCGALRGGERLFASDDWTRALTGWAARILGSDLALPTPSEVELEAMALRVLEGSSNDNRATFLARAAVEGTAPRDLGRLVAIWAALRSTVGDVASEMGVVTSAASAVKVLEQLCRRFPAYAAQLRQRHDDRPTLVVKDEYDVQDALHAALRLHFTDVRDEEWTPSYAATSTRLDLLLKGEKVVLETKMTRAGLMR